MPYAGPARGRGAKAYEVAEDDGAARAGRFRVASGPVQRRDAETRTADDATEGDQFWRGVRGDRANAELVRDTNIIPMPTSAMYAAAIDSKTLSFMLRLPRCRRSQFVASAPEVSRRRMRASTWPA